MKARILRFILFVSLIVGPLIIGAVVRDMEAVQASSGECWRIDRENCYGCGACWALFDWMFEEGPDGFPRFISPNDCGTVTGSDQSVIQVVDPWCIGEMHDIDDELPYDHCIEPCE